MGKGSCAMAQPSDPGIVKCPFLFLVFKKSLDFFIVLCIHLQRCMQAIIYLEQGYLFEL